MSNLRERVKALGNPLIDGSRVTFVWQGDRPPPPLAGDFNFWRPIADRKWSLAEPGLWIHRRKLPRDAYVEYGFGEGDARVADPLNPRTTFTGLGKLNNYFHMPDARVEAVAMRTDRHEPGALRGTLTEHEVATVHEVWTSIGARFAVGDTRRVLLYRPPSAGPVPLLVLFDGLAFVYRIGAANIIDALIAGGWIRPIAVAFVAAADPFDFAGGETSRGRELEYACNLATAEFLVRAVLPLAEQHLELESWKKRAGVHAIGGISLGAEQALFTALRASRIFGSALCMSGLFSGTMRNPAYDLLASHPRARPGGELWAVLRRAREPWAPARRPLHRLWLQCGHMEVWAKWTNRALARMARSKRYQVQTHCHPGGHNWTSWMNTLPLGLEFLFDPRP